MLEIEYGVIEKMAVCILQVKRIKFSNSPQ